MVSLGGGRNQRAELPPTRVGTTSSRKRLDRILAETYDNADKPLSEFASSQDVDFYDHDFLECHRITKSTNDARALLTGMSFAPTYIDPASAAAAAFMPANTAIVLFAEGLLKAPLSASDQWIIQDHGHYGLTRVYNTVRNGERTFPWHGSRLSVGAIVFEWYCSREA